jgi:tetratricopeptide (TPR) repeat protein
LRKLSLIFFTGYNTSFGVRMKKVLAVLVLLLSLPLFAERILVFPFTQSGDDISTLWLEMGISAALEESLLDNGSRCISIDDLENYFKEKKLVSQPKFPFSAQIGLSRAFGASHLLSGGYTIVNGEISIEMTAVSLEREVKMKGSWNASGNVKDLRLIAEALSKKFLESMGEKYQPHAAVNPEAFESYIRGRIVMDPTLKEVYFRRAVEIAPDYNDAQCLLAQTLKEEGEITESFKILESLRKKSYARSSLGLRVLGELKMESGKLSEAKELFISSLRQVENAEGHLLLARLYLKQGKKDEALKETRVAESFGTHADETAKLFEEIEKSK